VIYDVSGRVVATPVNGVVGPGRHTRVWDGRENGGGQAVAGIYFLSLEAIADGERFTAKRRLVRLD
jgi:hypothetical protein